MGEKNKKPTFEESLSRLEDIVKKLDNPQTPLDESIELFEEGVGLVKSCNGMLDEVERRIKIISDGKEVEFKGE